MISEKMMWSRKGGSCMFFPLYFPTKELVHLLVKLNVQGSSLLLIAILKSPFTHVVKPQKEDLHVKTLKMEMNIPNI